VTTPPALPHFAELQAPASWRTIDFISDLHLQAAEPETFEAWRHYMAHTPADAVFILGDLFEAWVGDDAAGEPGFAADCAAVLHAAAGRMAVFFMHGNRDFLVGEGKAS
jgi:UDP-2,3-diacylglucosamine hydrolase